MGYHRVTYFVIGQALYVADGFRKKSAKTPKRHIDFAKKMYKYINKFNMKNAKAGVRQSKIVDKKKEKLEWYSFEDVFAEFSKNKAFLRAYNEELQRRSLAKQIRALRSAQKLTQKVVAERAGMPQSVIARIESGQSGISLDTLGRVAHTFGKHIQLA